MKRGDLQPDQLCDLLNFVLERPNKKLYIAKVSIVAVKSWAVSDSFPVELWCDHKLRECGILKKQVGRNPVTPRVVIGFLAQQGGRI